MFYDYTQISIDYNIKYTVLRIYYNNLPIGYFELYIDSENKDLITMTINCYFNDS